jgi:hypothetical protein
VIRLVGSALIVGTGVLAWLFVVLYHVRQPWWRSAMGQHIMTYSVVVTAVLTLSAIGILIGRPAWFEVLRLVVFCGVPVAIGWRIVILLRVPPGRRRRR